MAREVRVRRGLNISDLKSYFVPRPGLSVRGGATSAAVGKMRRSTVVINSRKSCRIISRSRLGLVVGLGGDEAAEEQGYPHVVVVLMDLRATDAGVMDGCSFQVGDGAGDGSSVKNAGEGDFLHGSAPFLEDFSSLENGVLHLGDDMVTVDFFSDDAYAQAAGRPPSSRSA